MVEELMGLTYSELQQKVLSTFPGKPPRGTDERRAEISRMTDEDLLVAVEYSRRNMRWGRYQDDVVTYEDAMKVLYVPELMRRLEEKGK